MWIRTSRFDRGERCRRRVLLLAIGYHQSLQIRIRRILGRIVKRGVTCQLGLYGGHDDDGRWLVLYGIVNISELSMPTKQSFFVRVDHQSHGQEELDPLERLIHSVHPSNDDKRSLRNKTLLVQNNESG